MTHTYLYNRDIAIKIHHRYHPILFDWDTRSWLGGINRPIFTVQKEIEDGVTYYIQICYLNSSDLISYYRTSVTNWKDLLIPIPPKNTTHLSIFIANTSTRKWWVQII